MRTARLITLPLPGKNGWKCTINREIAIVGEAGRPAPIHAQENVYATEFFAGWKLPGAAPKLIFNIAMADAISAMTVCTAAMGMLQAAPSARWLNQRDAPTVKSNVIPAFSIYYLLMVHDHMMCLGVKRLLSAICQPIDGILGFF